MLSVKTERKYCRSTYSIRIQHESDVSFARQNGKRLAEEVGLSEVDTNLIRKCPYRYVIETGNRSPCLGCVEMFH